MSDGLLVPAPIQALPPPCGNAIIYGLGLSVQISTNADCVTVISTPQIPDPRLCPQEQAMKHVLSTLMLTAAYLMVAPQVWSQDKIMMATPVFGQIVVYPLPPGFAPSFEELKGTFYIQESVLSGESVDDWSQMFTMTGLKLAKQTVTLDRAAQNMAGPFQQACSKAFSAISYGPTQIDGRPAMVIL
jgi:hypothetical protein